MNVLVCVLEPGGQMVAGGPADVVLTVEEPAGPSSFHVQGSATLSGFVFVVWLCAGGHPDVRQLPSGRVWGRGLLTHSPHRSHLCTGAPCQ